MSLGLRAALRLAWWGAVTYQMAGCHGSLESPNDLSAIVDLFRCTPNAFLRCDGKNKVSCNADGDAEVFTVCADDGNPCTDDACLATTMDCGHVGLADGQKCTSTTIADGVCVNQMCHCGDPGEPCCSGMTCTGTQACSNGTCGPCGANNQPCCTGNVCTGAGLLCSGGTCILDCDDGNPCTVDTFIASAGDGGACNYVPGNSGTICRASVGTCDIAESCTGSSATCPVDTFQANTVVCRASAGVCDVAENCTGTSAACPSDAKQPNTAVCRPAAGVCDVAENCDGTAVACPSDAKKTNTTVCRASIGVCDVAENCDGTTINCPSDGFLPNTTPCRPSAGICDVAENCTGSAATCPIDIFLPNTTLCRPSAGVCDVTENCSGSAAACPTDVFVPNTTVCRASAGVCDLAENCSGNSAACPSDGFKPNTTVCRVSAGVCDLVENCTGNSAACPTDGFKPNTTVCRAAVGPCDAAENCTGSSTACPTDVLASSSTVCRVADACNAAKNCTGSSTSCPPVTDVVWNGGCYYLDGSKGACRPGYVLASQQVLAAIGSFFVGKTYKTVAADNCCVFNSEPDEDYGMAFPGDCTAALGVPWTIGPGAGLAGCTDQTFDSTNQLTFCGTAYTNGMGGVYADGGSVSGTLSKQENARLACESVNGVGGCCTDGCSSCNNRGYHQCGTPNCGGSTYWNFFDTTQNMSCGWADANEILISLDSKNWIQ